MYCFVNDFLDEGQVNQIISVGESSEPIVAKFDRGTEGSMEDQGVRSVNKLSCLKLENDIEWLHNHLKEVSEAVKSLFESQYNISVDVSGGLEKSSGSPEANYLVYNNSDDYNWHKDSNTESEDPSLRERVLSATIQLSDSSEYEGGELVLNLDGENGPKENTKNNITAPKDKGSCSIFLSQHVFHKVNAVTSGTRKALVVWFHLNNDD